jgi:hypothetical protein
MKSNFEKTLSWLNRVSLPFQKVLSNFNENYPNTSQNIQFNFIFFFALVDLLYGILSQVFALGYMPQYLVPFYPFIRSILDNPILKIWTSPEKVFFLSYVVIELLIIQNTFKVSKLIKYNILLIFSLLMVQGLILSYWDTFFNRQISDAVTEWIYASDFLIYTDKRVAMLFFLLTFLSFMGIYLYLYYKAVFKAEFATIPCFEWLTDSVAFWLKIKTPTMRFGQRKKKK